MDTEKRLSDFVNDGKSLILNFPLYTKIKVNIDIEEKSEQEILYYDDDGCPNSVNYTYFYENSDFRFLKLLVFGEQRIYAYCPLCNKELYLIHFGKELDAEYKEPIICRDENINSDEMYNACLEYAERKFIDRFSNVINACIDNYRNFTINLECTSRHKHNIQVMFHLTEDNYLIKIGQYPSIIDFKRSNIKKYSKVLKNYGKEYYNAIFLQSHDYGIASYVYLRRIFEGLIIEKMNKKAEKDKDFNKEDFMKLHMNEKIEALQSDLPPFLINNKPLYGVLSKGIHQLTENECLEYFNTVNQAIEIILDEKIEKLKKQNMVQNTKKNLNEIVRKIK